MDNRNYREFVEKDTIEQFRGKPNIQVLHDALARQLQDLHDFFLQLKTGRSLSDAVGAQLDGVGDIVVLSRREAGDLASYAGRGGETDDETYRKFLVYKVLKNTCDCTYPNIIKAFRMFWDKPLYYSENPEYPAVMFLETGLLAPEDHAENLLAAPIIKAAGVGIHITATTESPEMERTIHFTPVLGRGLAITSLPVLEPELSEPTIYITPVLGRGMSVTRLPPIEPVFATAVAHGRASAALHTATDTALPVLPEFDTVITAAAHGRATADAQSITQTKLPELKEDYT